MIIGMDYYNQHVPIHYRVCGQRITATKSISYECKEFSAELKIAFEIDTSGDDVNIHPEMSACTQWRGPSVPSQRE